MSSDEITYIVRSMKEMMEAGDGRDGVECRLSLESESRVPKSPDVAQNMSDGLCQLCRWAVLCMCGHTFSKSADQPGKVARPARGQLNRKIYVSLSAFVLENLVPRDGFGSPVPRQPAHFHTQAESGAYL